MKNYLLKTAKLLIVFAVSLNVSSCEEPRVYGSVGVSSFSGGGYHGGSRVGGSITIGGRIR